MDPKEVEPFDSETNMEFLSQFESIGEHRYYSTRKFDTYLLNAVSYGWIKQEDAENLSYQWGWDDEPSLIAKLEEISLTLPHFKELLTIEKRRQQQKNDPINVAIRELTQLKNIRVTNDTIQEALRTIKVLSELREKPTSDREYIDKSVTSLSPYKLAKNLVGLIKRVWYDKYDVDHGIDVEKYKYAQNQYLSAMCKEHEVYFLIQGHGEDKSLACDKKDLLNLCELEGLYTWMKYELMCYLLVVMKVCRNYPRGDALKQINRRVFKEFGQEGSDEMMTRIALEASQMQPRTSWFHRGWFK